MSYQSDNLDLEILEEGDPADLTTVSDNFDKIDAVAGDIATIETSPTQSSHAAGEFLLYEGRLYKVTSAISAGGSLILGTNVSAANIGDELKSLKESVDQKVGSIGNMDSYFEPGTNANQVLCISFLVKNTTHARYNHRMVLMIRDGGIALYDSTAGAWVWYDH